MNNINPIEALQFLENAENMPNTNHIAKSICPHVSDAAKAAILTAYDLYHHGLKSDTLIAVGMLYTTSMHGITDPLMHTIDGPIRATTVRLITRQPPCSEKMASIARLTHAYGYVMYRTPNRLNTEIAEEKMENAKATIKIELRKLKKTDHEHMEVYRYIEGRINEKENG